MALSSVTYTGNGSTTSFAIPFPYLFQSDVSATVNGVTTAFTWTNPALIHFATAPATGTSVFIVRKTNITTLDVVFTDGSTVQASDINTAELQSLYLAQEANDGVSVAIAAAATATAATGAANAAAAAANAAVAGLVPFTGDHGAGGVGGLVPAPPTGSFAAGKFLSAGGSFLVPPGAGVGINVVTAGADPTGAVDATSVFQTVFNTVGPTGGLIVIPPGRYKIAGTATLTIAALKSVSIFGSGQDVTTLFTPTGSPLIIALGDAVSSSFHLRDLTITTQAVGAGTALTLTAPRAGVQENNATSDITNVTIRGDDTVSVTSPFHVDYFLTGIAISGGVSGINFYGLNMPGVGVVLGTGVSIVGDPPNSLYGLAYNFTSCTFYYMAVPISVGSFVQGLEIVNSQFVGSTNGIIIQAGSTGQFFGLSVTTCEFACKATCISAGVAAGNCLIVGNVFEPLANGSSTVSGIFTASTFVGNAFINSSSFSSNALVIAPASTGVMVSGNTFIGGFSVGVFFQTGAANSNLQSNLYNGVTNPCSPTVTTGTIKIGGGST